MGNLAGKVAIVTGASGGIGSVIAKRLAQDGAKVIVHFSSSREKAQQVVKAIQQAGGQASAVEADLGNQPDIGKLVKTTIDQYGGLDIFVSNAGKPSREPMLEVTTGHFDEIFAINARGTFFSLQEAGRRIRENGRIINISSGQTIHPAVDFALYAGSKAAGNAFVKVLAQELGNRKITVNNIVAGPIEVGFLADADTDYKEMMAQANPLGRLGTAQDVADVVSLIASEEARWITGQDIIVDGGATHF